MPGETFRYRTVLEVAVISIVIYVLLGTPGLQSLQTVPQPSDQGKIPVAKPKVGQLVYRSKDLKCPKYYYDTHIFSTRPLVLYVDGFLSGSEVEHLIALSENIWNVSTVYNAGVEMVDPSVRKSDKAAIERDNIVQCIEERALAFQGWPKDTFIERLWTQRYNVSGHYALHYDWGITSKSARRVSSFMVYLSDRCQGGGTHFPRLSRPDEQKWCEFVECNGAEGSEGVTFKPRAGSAVFWQNFDSEGRGYKETIHAGLPVTSGEKVGLNIWTWYQAGHQAPLED